MKSLRTFALVVALCVTSVGSAYAQGSNDQQRTGSSTVSGDTGLWFVPLAETLPKGKWAGGLQRVDINRSEGFVNVEDIGGMFAFGATDKIEVFGALGRRGVDADLISPKLTGLGQPQDYLINQGWTDGLGDLTVGAKINLHSQIPHNGYGAAIRLGVKVPTAGDGMGNDKPSFTAEFVGSREVNMKVDLTMSAGFKGRMSPDGYSLTNGFIYGFGAGFPSRSKFKVIGEMSGEAMQTHSMTFTGAQTPTTPPASWEADATRDMFAGLQYHFGNGTYLGAGVNYAASHLWDRKNFETREPENTGQDKWAFQLRLGYHPGVRNYVPPPPPAPVITPAVQPQAPANRPPTVRARCEPCTIQVGRSIMVTADAQDPDGDTLRYRWTGPTGTFANAAERQTQWTAPGQPGAVPLTVTVDDGKGGTASDTVTIQVIAPPAKREITFEDVHFDFDRYSLRPEATRILDEAIKNLTEDPNLRITVEGHTCNIGTVEYNLALGDRRANAVRDYLTSRGVAANRLQTVSYGEERPKFDNSREETRRLNRRAALTIRVQ